MNSVMKALLLSRFQLLAGYFTGAGKVKKKRSPIFKVGMAALFLYVVGVFACMFGMMFMQLSEAFHMLNIEWLYFTFAEIMAVVLMFVGSIFMTQSQLYDAKDNEMLLAMPIKPGYILLSRMIMLYVYNLAFGLLVMLPAGFMQAYHFGLTVSQGIVITVICLILPLLSMTLAAVIGWLVAAISSRTRNKSLFTMIFTVIFLVVYFIVYTQMSKYMQMLISNGEIIAGVIKGGVYPLYLWGSAAADGNFLYLLIVALCCIIPFITMYFILASTFIKIATTKRGFAKIKYKEQELKTGNVQSALFGKELKHFFGSPMYILNGSLGVVMTLIGAGALVFNKSAVDEFIAMDAEFSEMIVPLLIVAMAFMATTNIITAPSISLEGKNMWILKSLPIKTRDILMSKVKLHLVICIPSVVLAVIIGMILFEMSLYYILLALVLPTVVTIMCALTGILVNLKFPKFDWVSEAVAVKQSASTMIAMFGTMALMMIPVMLYIPLSQWIILDVYIGLWTVIYGVFSYGLYRCMCTWGVRTFEKL